MTRTKTLIGVGIMVLLILTATVSAFAAAAPGTTPEENLKYRIERLQERVDAGILTQEQADQMAATMTANFANCDGTRFGTGQGTGLCLGQGNANGQGNRAWGGNGRGCGGGMMRQGQ